MPWQKSVVGAGVFTHEAGIHVDGLLKDPANYQGFDPQRSAAATASCSASIPASARCGWSMPGWASSIDDGEAQAPAAARPQLRRRTQAAAADAELRDLLASRPEPASMSEALRP